MVIRDLKHCLQAFTRLRVFFPLKIEQGLQVVRGKRLGRQFDCFIDIGLGLFELAKCHVEDGAIVERNLIVRLGLQGFGIGRQGAI